jgi:tetratricopeptide (TPR) repeat protein
MNSKLLLAKDLADVEPDEALRLCNEVMDETFDDESAQMALFLSGYIMMNAERFGLAFNIFKRCAELRPDQAEIYVNMGMCLEDDPDEAALIFKKALKIDPSSVTALCNLALTHLNKGHADECIALCNKVLKIKPDSEAATHNRGLAKLMRRDWGGWVEYAQTLGVKGRAKKDYGYPDWNGEPGTVLVYGEQGVGDEVMFASCLNELADTNTVILDCDRRLETIFKRSFDFEVHGERFSKEPLQVSESPDFQCAIGQLPYFFRKKDDDFPGEPYLKVCPERKKQWEVVLKDKPRIGIAWNGGTKNTRQKFRSLSIDDFKPVLNLDAEIVNLEYKPVDGLDLYRYEISNWPRAVLKGCDLEDTLALISCLDCVVTVCTTVVYLAGSIGVPCYVWVPEYCGYRYHNNGSVFPWYNSVKLFRKDIGEIAEHVKDIHRIRPKRSSGLSRVMSLDPAPV